MVDRHPDPSRRRFLAATAATGAALVLPGALAACNIQKGASPEQKVDPDASWDGSVLIDPPYDKPDATFIDTDGNPYPLREKTAGRLGILFFGYTHCPDICPTYLGSLASALENLKSGPGSAPIVLFVGVDVARDTPEYMKRYLSKFDPSFIGLTAEEPVIAQAITDLKLPQPVIGEPDGNGDYEVGHPAHIVILSPDDLVHRMYPSNTRQQQWVQDLPRLDSGLYA